MSIKNHTKSIKKFIIKHKEIVIPIIAVIIIGILFCFTQIESKEEHYNGKHEGFEIIEEITENRGNKPQESTDNKVDNNGENISDIRKKDEKYNKGESEKKEAPGNKIENNHITEIVAETTRLLENDAIWDNANIELSENGKEITKKENINETTKFDNKYNDISENETIGKENAGKETAGKEITGKESAGKETTGKETTGKETTGKESAGKETAGKESAGKETTGEETEGKEIAGKETVGEETTGEETAGKETDVKETGVKETAEKENTVKETTGKETAKKETEGKETAGKVTTVNEITKKEEQINKETTQSREKIIVSISIDCSNVFSNLNMLENKEAMLELLPENGMIINKLIVSIPKGTNVFEALKFVCDTKKVHLDCLGENDTAYGTAYIKGIGNLYEKNCGRMSGWMYLVNGNTSGVGCSKYILNDGDVIEWKYTCDGGRDIFVR